MSESATGIPRIGDIAPDFNANTTEGPIKFSEWQGDKWAILFSHPADFTPVCSTELGEFAKRKAEFDALGTKLIGLSVDSIHSHLAWRENLKRIMNVELNYPLISDIDAKVSHKFGMLHPGESETVTVRAVFLIDPSRKVRALVYYPLNVGRNIDEIKRLLLALQMTDKHKVAAPVNWSPGDKVIVPPPKTVADVAERLGNKSYEQVDFYLNKKSL